jgi:hypothetical protein
LYVTEEKKQEYGEKSLMRKCVICKLLFAEYCDDKMKENEAD